MKTIFRFFFLVYSAFANMNPLHAQWVQTNGPYGGSIQSFAVSGTNLFAGTYYGGVYGGDVFRSTNNGTSWTATGLTYTTVLSLAVSGTNLFAGTYGGVFLSTNNGTSWTAVNTGLTSTYVLSLAVSGANLFAGTYGGGVWRRPLSEITSVRLSSNELPSHFELAQNFPNPFNPTSTIRFQVPHASHVSLSVYDVLGREVARLVNEQLAPGTYETTFDGLNLSSGVYFYRLHAEGFVQVRKLVLQK